MRMLQGRLQRLLGKPKSNFWARSESNHAHSSPAHNWAHVLWAHFQVLRRGIHQSNFGCLSQTASDGRLANSDPFMDRGITAIQIMIIMLRTGSEQMVG